ncbi:shikimate kinase [Gelidibacter salicanalis]|uniref:Shikimate kinase n=1 Tax=Gelidibacter salicanalis TaxID=291193 RepID=A0A5C7A9W7_9FLAO|nr:shikimate kinase [Gelidibacter salicanalis]TXE05496.1 shikimate kinase [Gelidibacter salicanalis]
MKIILIGYMGSGKSTIGKNVSKMLNFDFIDLDDYIQEKEQLTIPQIFDRKGEIYFRKKEHVYLKEVLERTDVVVSLGGGTPCYGSNMAAVLSAKDAHSVYLKSSIPNLVQRLLPERLGRPLIAHITTEEDLTEFVGKHLFERSYYYSQCTKTLVTDGKTVSELTEEIVRLF